MKRDEASRPQGGTSMNERFPVAALVLERPHRRAQARLGVFGFGLVFALFAGVLGGFFASVAAIVTTLVVASRVIEALAGGARIPQTAVEVEPGRVCVEATGLEYAVREGIESAEDGSVVLDLEGGDVMRLRLTGDLTAGERLLQRLGVGASQRTVQVPLRRIVGAGTMAFVTFIGGVIASVWGADVVMRTQLGYVDHAVGYCLSFGSAFLLTALVLMRFGSPRVIVGSDGIRIRGMLRQPFLPYAQIARATDEGWEVRLQMRDGRIRRLPAVSVDQERVRGLVARIERARLQAGGSRVYLAESLARAGRSESEWHAALARLASPEVGFREMPLDRDDVERVLTDPSAKPDQRVGAAFVLTRIDAAAGAERVRVAAEAIADDALRAELMAMSKRA